MSERAAFINAILDNPDDDTARLVFADWLEEHGEPERAEFIRCQIEAAKLPKAQREKSKPAKRADRLLKAHEAAWRKVVPAKQVDSFYPYGDLSGVYERGFLTDIGILSAEFLDVAGPLLEVEPATFILFLGEEGLTPRSVRTRRAIKLANSPCLRAVVDLHCCGESDEYLRLINSPHLSNAGFINLSESFIQAKHVEALLESPTLHRLERLHLSSAFGRYEDGRGYYQDMAATVKAVKLLATAPQFKSLKLLDLSDNALGDQSIELLLASTTLPRTLRLDLHSNAYDKERYAKALAERFTGGSDGEEE